MPITTTPSGGPQGEFSTYTPIYAQTLSADTSSITFSNIPTTFTDLVLVCSTGYTSTNIGQGLGLRFNGDSASNYSGTFLEGDGTSASSYRGTNQTSGAMGAPSNGNQSSLTPITISILNYSNITTFKSWISRCSGPTYVQAIAGVWRATPQAITSITVFAGATATNIKSGSTFTIYGIKAAAPAPKATGGDLVYTDNTYWYHVFNNSGIFDVKTAMNVDYLVVAGGGGGGSATTGSYRSSGGGGAGGYRTSVGTSGGGASAESSLSLSNVAYTVTVGGGGVGATGSSGAGSNGSNSSIIGAAVSITSIGGGKANDLTNSGGTTGGSGGGTYGGNTSAGAGTANQGFAGGVGQASDPEYGGGGGGGGAGGVGGNGSTGNVTTGGGAGGSGITSSISGTSVARAGGGGAGRGGSASAGGGAGAAGTGNGTSGTTNTGGGGGGTGSFGGVVYTAGAGGSGVVIVRYPV